MVSPGNCNGIDPGRWLVLALSFQFGASFLTRASWTRTSLARPTSTRCQFGARQFGAYSSLTRGSSARFASLARCSFFTFTEMNNVEM